MPYQQNGVWYNDLGAPVQNGSDTLAGLDNPGSQQGFANGANASGLAYLSSGTAPTQHSPQYWATHKATTPQEAQEKMAAYWAAANNGIKGQPYLDHSELALISSDATTASDVTTTLKGAAGGATVGGSVGGPIGGAVGGALGAVGGGVVAAFSHPDGTKANSPEAIAAQGNYSAADFGGGSRSNPTLPAGYGGGSAGGGGAMPGGFAPQTGTTGNPYLDAILAQTGQATGANQQILNNTVLPAIKNQTDVNYQVGAGLGQNLRNESQLIGGYGAFNGGLAAQGQTAAAQANTSNLGYLQSYQDTLSGMSQLAPTPYQGDWVSNAGDVARQQSSYNQLSGIGNGSLDYTAQQAALAQAAYERAAYEEAHSNPGDVQNESDALAQLTRNAGGALDVKNGAASPEAYQAQLSALAKMQGLTDPQRTAQEEFLYEQQRAREEQDQRSSRAAVMQKYRQRGMSGSGMELTDQLGSDQITSQNRLLGDLGTQATAVARANAMLQGVGQMSTAMVGQGNQIAQGNQSVRANSAVAQGGLASDIRGQGLSENQFNANAFNQNQEFNANAFNQNQNVNAQLRESNAEFNAGAQNTASANNQATRAQGAVAAGSQAASMRAASDAVGMANQAQQGISNRANDVFRSDQQLQATNRATSLFNAGQGTTQTNLGNTERAIGASSSLGDKTMGMGMQGVQDTGNYWSTLGSLGQQNVNNALGYGTLATGVNTSGASTANDALSKAAGNFAANQASGMLGTNIYTPQTAYQPYVNQMAPTPRYA